MDVEIRLSEEELTLLANALASHRVRLVEEPEEAGGGADNADAEYEFAGELIDRLEEQSAHLALGGSDE